MWKAVGIAGRLWLVVGALSLALAGVAAFAYVRLTAVVDAAHLTERTRVPQLAEADAMELNITRVSLQIRHAMLARTSAERADALADIGAKRSLVVESAAAYERALYTERGKVM